MTATESTRRDFDVFQRRSLVVGITALAACAAGAVASPEQFFRSYLLAYLFWIGIALGCFAVVMLHHLVGGGWGFVIRRLLESGTRTLPLMLVLLIPLLFGLRYIYVWARPEAVAADELLQHKSAYLNVPFFLVRTAFYFAAWLGLAYFLNKWSAEQDRAPSAGIKTRLQNLSGPGLVLYGLTVTFASVDWVMSLEPHWFSTIYGIIFMVGQALATLAFVIAALMLLANRRPLADVLRPQHFHDLGNLMLAFVMLWAYVAFSQFLIIWSGNLPEETPWYIARFNGGWGWIAVLLIVFHFMLPFLLLLSRQNKRRLRMLASIAAAMIVVRFLDMLWVVLPAFHAKELRIHWMDLLAPVGIGGIWLATFVWQLKGRPMLPAQPAPLGEGLAS
jgi:hypothetical protein